MMLLFFPPPDSVDQLGASFAGFAAGQSRDCFQLGRAGLAGRPSTGLLLVWRLLLAGSWALVLLPVWPLILHQAGLVSWWWFQKQEGISGPRKALAQTSYGVSFPYSIRQTENHAHPDSKDGEKWRCFPSDTWWIQGLNNFYRPRKPRASPCGIPGAQFKSSLTLTFCKSTLSPALHTTSLSSPSHPNTCSRLGWHYIGWDAGGQALGEELRRMLLYSLYEVHILASTST